MVNSPNILLYLLTTASVGMFGVGLTDLLLKVIPNFWRGWGPPLAVMAIGGASAWLASRSLAKRVSPSKRRINPSTEVAVKRRGLILLLSPRPTNGLKPAAEVAIEHHGEVLTHIWIIHSERSADFCKDLETRYTEEGKTVKTYQVDNPHSIVECFRTIDFIYGTLPAGLKESDVVTDYTGMTSSASAGAVLACHTSERPLEYVELPAPGCPTIPPRDVIFSFDRLTQPVILPQGATETSKQA